MSNAPSGGAGPPPCPGCGGPLEIEFSDDGVRRYTCQGCGGVMCGEAVLRKIAGTLRAEHTWGSAFFGGVPADGRCPFCSQTMWKGTVEQGRVWACKADGMAWVDKDALAFFAGTGPSAGAGDAAPAAPAEPIRCPNCGAPVQRSWDQNCEFCGASLVAPGATPQVVVVERDPAPTPETLTGHLLRKVADVLDSDTSAERRRW